MVIGYYLLRPVMFFNDDDACCTGSPRISPGPGAWITPWLWVGSVTPWLWPGICAKDSVVPPTVIVETASPPVAPNRVGVACTDDKLVPQVFSAVGAIA